MGAGGNLIRNIISMDTRFEFLDDLEFTGVYPTAHSRFEFLERYYKKAVESTTWLTREWSTRSKFHSKYYLDNGIEYWNPDERLVYLIHGTYEEIYSILLDRPLKSYDRVQIADGTKPEIDSLWTVQDCQHVFLLPNSIENITDVYVSKNASLNQFDQASTVEARYAAALAMNNACTDRLYKLKDLLARRNKPIINLTAEDLFVDSTIIKDLAAQLGLEIPAEYVDHIHTLWLQSTRALYYNTFKRDLTI